MPKFTIYWTENCFYTMNVEGDSVEQVLDDFHAGVYDMGNGHNYGVEMEDSIEVVQV